MRRTYPAGASTRRGIRTAGGPAYAGAMDGRWTALVARVQAYFGVDTAWERVPADPGRARRVDTWLALAFFATGSLGIELLRSIDALGPFQHSWLWPHAAVLAGTVPLVWRRRWPLAVAAGLSLHFFVVGLTVPGVAASVPMQVVYFVAIFTGVAWARDRRAMIGVVVGPLQPCLRLRHLHAAHQRLLLRRGHPRWTGGVAIGLPA